MRQDGERFSLSCLFSKRTRYVWPVGLFRNHNTVASEKAHARYALPIVVPEAPDLGRRVGSRDRHRRRGTRSAGLRLRHQLLQVLRKLRRL